MLVHAILNKQREKVKTYNIYSAYDKRYIRESNKGKKLEPLLAVVDIQRVEIGDMGDRVVGQSVASKFLGVGVELVDDEVVADEPALELLLATLAAFKPA